MITKAIIGSDLIKYPVNHCIDGKSIQQRQNFILTTCQRSHERDASICYRTEIPANTFYMINLPLKYHSLVFDIADDFLEPNKIITNQLIQ